MYKNTLKLTVLMQSTKLPITLWRAAEIAWSRLEDKHTVCVSARGWSQSQLMFLNYTLSPVYLLLPVAFQSQRESLFHSNRLLNLELSCNSPHIISSLLKLRVDHRHGKSSFPSLLPIPPPSPLNTNESNCHPIMYMISDISGEANRKSLCKWWNKVHLLKYYN